MAAPHLAQWTPVAVATAGASAAIDWGDLRGVRFAEPFFDQTVERWAGDDPAPLVRTDLTALRDLDDDAAHEPAALIFHLSRCGSTLVSRLLGSVPGVVAITEPAPVNALLRAPPERLAPFAPEEVLRLLIRALGRRRFGDERHYVLKLSSWNVMRFDLFRRAFPRTPVIWLQREPEAVMASLLARPPGWFGLRLDRAAARSLFGIDAPAPPPVEDFALRVLAALLTAARDIAAPAICLDYDALPAAVWTGLAPLLGIDLDDRAIEEMQTAAHYYSKDIAPRRFTPDGHTPPPLPAVLRAQISETLQPLYRAIGARTTAVPVG